MKKILLATTILVGSAGVAAADIAFSGEAWVGIASTNGGATWNPTVTASMDVAMSGETDGGLMFGADFTLHAVGASGNAGAGTPVEDETNSAVEVWLSGTWGKLTLSNTVNNYDEVTLEYEYTMSAFTVEATYVWDELDLGDGDWSLMGTYDAGSYEFWLKYAHDNSAGTNTTSLGGEAEFGMITVSAEIGDISASSTTWELGLGYASGAISADATLTASSGLIGATTGVELELGYDLGGGAVVEAMWSNVGTTVSTDDSISLGISMEF